jgi:hypothetical protein
MLAEKTVFILGAGSNADLNFPVGSHFRDSIVRKLTVHEFDGFRRSSDFLKQCLNAAQNRLLEKLDRSGINKSAELIRQGLLGVASIDDFIATHRDNDSVTQLVKICVVDEILNCESHHPLCDLRADLQLGVTATCYAELWRRITKGVSSKDIFKFLETLSEKLTIVTFNYDRSLEQLFYLMLTKVMGADPQQAAEMIQRLPVIHVFGSPGKWGIANGQARVPGGPFGDVTGLWLGNADDGNLLVRLASGIKTYTEEVDTDKVARIHNLLVAANQIHFLGFAYHDQNMRLMFDGREGFSARFVGGTCKDLSEAHRSKLLDFFGGKTGRSAARNFGFLGRADDCLRYLGEYGHQIEGAFGWR